MTEIEGLNHGPKDRTGRCKGRPLTVKEAAIGDATRVFLVRSVKILITFMQKEYTPPQTGVHQTDHMDLASHDMPRVLAILN